MFVQRKEHCLFSLPAGLLERLHRRLLVDNRVLRDYDPTIGQQEDERAVHIVLVSSNNAFREQLKNRLAPLKWAIHEAETGADALDALITRHDAKMLLLDPALPDLLPQELCGLVREMRPQLEILALDTATCQVLVDGHSVTAFSSQVTRLLSNQADASHIRVVSRIAEHSRNQHNGPRLRGVIGDSPAMQRIYELTHMVASKDTTVLITGESGTGKDLIAQAIHQISPRRNSPLIIVNCAAIPEALLEAELFGYAKGAFTGAMQARIGRIHAANGGTLFLDEIGDMPLSLQSKILRFVEQGEVQRLGSNDNMRVDVRVVAATNAELPTLVKQKLFREDLYYRLAIFPIQLAPLREREDDLIGLAQFFAARFAPGVGLTADAVHKLSRHTWPGNVRELRNVIERASIMAGKANEISENDIIL